MAIKEDAGIGDTLQAEIIQLHCAKGAAPTASRPVIKAREIDPAFPAKLAAFQKADAEYRELPETIHTTFREAVYEELVPLRLQLLYSTPGTLADAAALQLIIGQELLDGGVALPSGILDGLCGVRWVINQHTSNGKPTEHKNYHAGRFQDYCIALNLLANVTGDEELAAAQENADTIFQNMMNAPAGSVAAVMFKAKAAALEANSHSETVVSPRVYGELFNILAAELETIVTMESGKVVLS